VQLPKTYTAPLSEDFHHGADDIIEFFSRCWLTQDEDDVELFEWQKWLLKRVLEKYGPDHPEFPNQYRYRQVLVSVPRQQGKSILASLMAFQWMLKHPGSNIIGLASSVDQAQIVYQRVSLVLNSHPALKKRFSKTTTTRGIASSDGRTTYQLKAAKSAALQGIALNLGVFDEVHLCSPDLWSDLVNGTATKDNAMVFGITTAGDQNSELLKSLYQVGERAADGDPQLERFGYFEWSAPAGSSVTDEDALLTANPSLAEGKISMANVLSDIGTMPEVDARRYRLNQFVHDSSQLWLPQSIFQQAIHRNGNPEGRSVFAIDRTHGWDYATITAATKHEDYIYSEVVASLIKPTKDQLLRICLELAKQNPLAFVAEGYMLKELMQDLQKSGLAGYSLNATEISSASSTAYALFAQGRVRINEDPLVISQSPFGYRKAKGDHWRIARAPEDNTSQIDALMATVMGIYLASRELETDIQLF